MVEEEKSYYYAKDHLGTIRTTINMMGETENAMDYFPYGEEIPDRSIVYGEQAKYKFTGKERDVETGYDYFGARYYNAKIGRWLSVDPLADKYPGLSPYNYVMNNPMILVDPDGKELKPKGEKAERKHIYFLENSPKYASLVSEINNILVENYNDQVIPLIMDLSSKEISSMIGIPANGVMSPGVTEENHWIVEGTEIYVANDISTSNLAETSTAKTTAHEVKHLLDFLKDPKAFEDEVRKNENLDWEEKSEEIRANETSEEINKEIYPYEYEIN